MTYQYDCTLCRHEWEVEQGMREPPVDECPRCHEKAARRVVSGGSGFSLKGGGWAKDNYVKGGA